MDRLTSHTSCLGGFCGPGGSVVEGSCTLESRATDDGERAFAGFGGLLKVSIVEIPLSGLGPGEECADT
jgi:hypothetical protein